VKESSDSFEDISCLESPPSLIFELPPPCRKSERLMLKEIRNGGEGGGRGGKGRGGSGSGGGDSDGGGDGGGGGNDGGGGGEGVPSKKKKKMLSIPIYPEDEFHRILEFVRDMGDDVLVFYHLITYYCINFTI
jgi:hypothetical protein